MNTSLANDLDGDEKPLAKASSRIPMIDTPQGRPQHEKRGATSNRHIFMLGGNSHAVTLHLLGNDTNTGEYNLSVRKH